MHHKILSPKWRLFSRGRWVRSCNHLPLWIASSFFPHLQKHQLEPKHCPLSSLWPKKGQMERSLIGRQASCLLMLPLGTNFNQMWIEIQQISYKEMDLKMSSAKWLSFVLTHWNVDKMDIISRTFQIHLILMLRIKLTKSHHWVRQWLNQIGNEASTSLLNLS